MSSWNVSERASHVHEQALVWDCHAGSSPYEDLDLSFVERWIEAGASYLSLNVGYDVVMRWDETLRCTAHYRRWIDQHPDKFIMADSVEDVRRAKSEGKLAVSFDLEGADALDDNIDMISLYYRLGVRHMNFAYNKNNAFGGGCSDVDIPLSPLGREAVLEMNRVGMVVDCSHTGYQTSMDIMELSSKPTIFSHSNPRALRDHPRNIRDDQITACARAGGVIGINGVNAFLGVSDPTPESLVPHIDYVADLVGVKHVGLGLDYVHDLSEIPVLFEKHPGAWPGYTLEDMVSSRFMDPEGLPRITELLLTRGYQEDEVRGILGENFLRVASEVWRPSVNTATHRD
jgi:membrane dipeptidase